MIIDRLPPFLKGFFHPVQAQLSKPQSHHLWSLVLAIAVTWRTSKLAHLAAAIHRGRHRTSLGAFLRRAGADAPALLERQAMAVLLSMKPRSGETLELLIDDHRSPKRGQKMACLSKIWDHVHQRFTRGHVWVSAAIRFRGVVLPWRLRLWKAKEHTGKKHYIKTTQIAAEFIRDFAPPAGLKVSVLFDAFYLCPTVTRAAQERGFLWFSVAARNRTFTRDGGKKAKLGQLAPGWVRHQGRYVRLPRSRGTRRMRIAAVRGRLQTIGRVQLVASKRPGDPWENLVVFATNAMDLKPRQIVSIYERRWAIEVMFKELRSDLGLDDYQVLDEQAIVTHVHLCALAHLLLTHHAMAGVGAQARKPHTKVTLPTMSIRRENLRAALRADQITRLLGGSKHRELRQKLQPYLNAA